jgi:hypothetical protein
MGVAGRGSDMREQQLRARALRHGLSNLLEEIPADVGHRL